MPEQTVTYPFSIRQRVRRLDDGATGIVEQLRIHFDGTLAAYCRFDDFGGTLILTDNIEPILPTPIEQLVELKADLLGIGFRGRSNALDQIDSIIADLEAAEK